MHCFDTHDYNIKYGASEFFLPSVSVEVGETVKEEEKTGRQPISDISLQQSLLM